VCVSHTHAQYVGTVRGTAEAAAGDMRDEISLPLRAELAVHKHIFSGDTHTRIHSSSHLNKNTPHETLREILSF
jgi:hypothetical protein